MHSSFLNMILKKRIEDGICSPSSSLVKLLNSVLTISKKRKQAVSFPASPSSSPSVPSADQHCTC